MAWEERNGHRYYYFKQREGNRVTSMYLGAGQIANIGAELGAGGERIRERERQIWSDLRAEVKNLEDTADQVSDLIRDHLHATLLVTGHPTHRGQWRKSQDEQQT